MTFLRWLGLQTRPALWTPRRIFASIQKGHFQRSCFGLECHRLRAFACDRGRHDGCCYAWSSVLRGLSLLLEVRCWFPSERKDHRFGPRRRQIFLYLRYLSWLGQVVLLRNFWETYDRYLFEHLLFHRCHQGQSQTARSESIPCWIAERRAQHLRCSAEFVQAYLRARQSLLPTRVRQTQLPPHQNPRQSTTPYRINFEIYYDHQRSLNRSLKKPFSW